MKAGCAATKPYCWGMLTALPALTGCEGATIQGRGMPTLAGSDIMGCPIGIGVCAVKSWLDHIGCEGAEGMRNACVGCVW